MTSPTRLVAAVALAAGLLPLSATSAHAESERVVDATRDVTTYSSEDTRPRTAPEERRADLKRVDFRYTADTLVVRMVVRDIPGQGRALNPVVRLRREGGRLYSVLPSSEGGLRLVGAGRTSYMRPCPEGSLEVLPAADAVRFEIPATCFSTPDEVRVGALMARSRFASSDDYVDYQDDVRTRSVAQRPLLPVKLGDPLRRG